MSKQQSSEVLSFQDLILKLQQYWAERGCVVMQPYDMEMGAGTFHPATFLRAIGPEPWSAAYVQPSRRPTDGRYGNNPFRLQHYYQYQVVITTGSRRRWAPGASAGRYGSMAWRSRSSPTSSRLAVSSAGR